ncbi:MAG: hypothetical protein GMKNLPBB_00712 [Myxococcota bacterium]|nr:hypothetical protein [Myxococcota bacterium]
MSRATAIAYANLGLAKYWGKRPGAGNLPAAGSVGVNLKALRTITTASVIDGDRDEIRLDGENSPKAAARAGAFLDLVRELAGKPLHFRIESRNDFPTAAGLASSSSGFAALAAAAAHAADLRLDERALSALARKGSGSAARAIPGGVTRLIPDVDEPYAVSIAPPEALPWVWSIGVAKTGPKDISSRDGMAACAETSSFHDAWIRRAREDAETLERLVLSGDVDGAGALIEANALAMHADGFAARPPLVYFLPATLAAWRAAVELRRQGVMAWFTCDAGPHPVLMHPPQHAARVRETLLAIPGLERVIVSAAAGGVEVTG